LYGNPSPVVRQAPVVDKTLQIKQANPLTGRSKTNSNPHAPLLRIVLEGVGRMKTRFVALAGAAAAMVATPVVANAAAAERAAAPVEGEQGLGGSLLIVLLAVAAVVAGIIIIADDDSPSSP
jgi:hypothetical protein